jgi:hypothetical protein
LKYRNFIGADEQSRFFGCQGDTDRHISDGREGPFEGRAHVVDLLPKDAMMRDRRLAPRVSLSPLRRRFRCKTLKYSRKVRLP